MFLFCEYGQPKNPLKQAEQPEYMCLENLSNILQIIAFSLFLAEIKCLKCFPSDYHKKKFCREIVQRNML